MSDQDPTHCRCRCSDTVGPQLSDWSAGVGGNLIRNGRSPCLQCTKMIINSGIVEVVFQSDYPLGKVSLELLTDAGIRLRQAG